MDIKTLTNQPGFRLLYGLAAGVAWGVACGVVHAPFWAVAIGGLAAAALALWLERATLRQAGGGRRTFPLLLAAAFGFLAVMAVGLVSLGYFLGEWLRH